MRLLKLPHPHLDLLLDGHRDAREERAVPLELRHPLEEHLANLHPVAAARLNVDLLRHTAAAWEAGMVGGVRRTGREGPGRGGNGQGEDTDRDWCGPTIWEVARERDGGERTHSTRVTGSDRL